MPSKNLDWKEMENWEYHIQGSKSFRQTLDELCDDSGEYDSADDPLALQPKNVTQSTSSFISSDSNDFRNQPMLQDGHHYHHVFNEDDEMIETLSDHSSTAFSLSDIFLDGDSIIPTSTLPTASSGQHQNYLHSSVEELQKNKDMRRLQAGPHIKETGSMNRTEHSVFADQVLSFPSNTHSKGALTQQTAAIQSPTLGTVMRLQSQTNNLHSSNNHLAQNTHYPIQVMNKNHRREERRKSLENGSNFAVTNSSNLPTTSNTSTNTFELPTTLHTFTVLKGMHHKKEMELQQKLDESKAREEEYRQRIQHLESSSNKVVVQSREILGGVNTEGKSLTLQEDPRIVPTSSMDPLQRNPLFNNDNPNRDNYPTDRAMNELEIMERKYQLELENMRIVAEQVQADADRRIGVAEKYAADISQQLQDMQQVVSSSQDATLWKRRLEHLVDTLCTLQQQGIWVTNDSTKYSFHQMVLDALKLGGERIVGNFLEEESWKLWISSLSLHAIDKDIHSREDNLVSVESNTWLLQIEQMKNAHARVVQENASLRLAKEATEEENLRVVQRGIDLEQVAEDAMKECEHLNKVLCTMKSEKELTSAIQEQLEVEITRLKDEVNMSHGLITRLQEDLASSQNLQTKTQQQISLMQKDLTTWETTSSNLKAQLEDKERLISESQRSKSEVEDELMCQKNVNAMMKRKLETSETEFSTVKERLSSISRDKENIEHMMDQIRTENMTLSHSKTDFELERSRLRKELDEKSGSIDFYAKEIASMRKEIVNAESEHLRISQKLDSVQHEKSVLSQELDLKNRAVNELSAEIIDYKERLQSLQGHFETVNGIRKALEQEREEINALIVSAHNDTFSQPQLKESLQYILLRLQTLILDKDTLNKEVSRIENMHLNEKQAILSARDELQTELNHLRTSVETFKKLEEEYRAEKMVLLAERERNESRFDRLLLDHQNELNDLLTSNKQLELECQRLRSHLTQEKEAYDATKKDLLRECDQLRSDLVELGKRKTAFLTEVQRITSPLISQNVSRTPPSDQTRIPTVSLNSIPYPPALKGTSDITSSVKVEPKYIPVKDSTQNSLSTVKHSLFPRDDNFATEKTSHRDSISSSSATSIKKDIETRLLSLNLASQRAMDAIKNLQSTNNKQSVGSTSSSPSLHLSATPKVTTTDSEISETEAFVNNLLFRK